MIPDRLQHFLDDFWNDQKCDQILTLGPLIYHQNTSMNTRNNMGTSLTNIIFIAGIWNSEICGKYACPTFVFSFLQCWNFENWKMNIWNMQIESWKLTNNMINCCFFWKLPLEDRDFEIQKYGNVKYKIRTFLILKFEKL